MSQRRVRPGPGETPCLSAAPNLRGALERVARYYALIHERTDLTLSVEGELAIFAHRKEGFPKPLPRHDPEMLDRPLLVTCRNGCSVAPLGTDDLCD